MSLKRYSSLLKRPEILETVYSVESEDGNEGKGEEKKDEKGEEGKEKKCEEVKEETEIEDDTSQSVTSSHKRKLVQMKRMESETTSYDWSTDSESLRLRMIQLITNIENQVLYVWVHLI